MVAFVLRRVLMTIPVFFGISIVIFLIVHVIPGSPIDLLMKSGSTAAQKAAMTERYGLDRSLAEQYLIWIWNVLRGDLGNAIVMRQPVSALIAYHLPYSLAIGASALVLSALGGVIFGALSAAFEGGRFDRFMMSSILLVSTIPSFWLGLMLILTFSAWLGWFPVSGAKGVSSLVLPTLTIALGGAALIARITRVSMLEAMKMDFVVLLYAKGLSRTDIILRHVLRQALIPVVTILSLRIGWILGGAVTVEYVFGRPGLGGLLIRALSQRDYPVVQGCLLMLSLAVMAGTLLGDIVQATMDPRARGGARR